MTYFQHTWSKLFGRVIELTSALSILAAISARVLMLREQAKGRVTIEPVFVLLDCFQLARACVGAGKQDSVLFAAELHELRLRHASPHSDCLRRNLVK